MRIIFEPDKDPMIYKVGFDPSSFDPGTYLFSDSTGTGFWYINTGGKLIWRNVPENRVPNELKAKVLLLT
jgi:hypothetical protein